jgi:dihydrolipoamide dehydrogenase
MALYDVIVIGSGPGGYVSAIKAVQLGLKTAVVERDSVGGVCLNWGCIPTKALLEAASNVRSAEKCTKYGIDLDKSGFSYAKVQKESRVVSERLAGGVKHLLAKNNIDLFVDSAKILPSGEIYLEKARTQITAKNILIATGSREKELPILPFDGEKILSSKDVLALEEIPKTIAIIGAGAIGVEFSQIFSTFGVKVMLIEMMPHILPQEDEEISSELEKALTSEGIDVLTDTKIEALAKVAGGYELSLVQGSSSLGKMRIVAEKILVAVGRQANIEGLGLEEAGIKTLRGFIETGDYYQTSKKGVYAIGDVNGQALLAHAASAQGLIAIDHIANSLSAGPRRLDIDSIPKAVYCEPQIASFGLTEKTAKAKGFDVAVGKFPFIGCGKAVATGKTRGFVKIFVDKRTKEILGATILGANATEIIHELLLAKSSELVPEDITNLIHAHPTYSETLLEAAKAVFGQPIHI